MNSQNDIRSLMQTFQDGYTRRNITQVDSFMQLFTSNAEIIGTNGVKPGVDEWYTDRASARELVQGDWEGWGDLRLDLDAMSIHQRGDVGWVAASATVTKISALKNTPPIWNSSRRSSITRISAPNKNCSTSCAAAPTPSMKCAAAKRSSGRCVLPLSSCAKPMAGSLRK